MHPISKEIAAKLNISARTVKFHVSALLAKFNVRNRLSLMLKADVLPFNASLETEPTRLSESRATADLLPIPARSPRFAQRQK